MNNKTDLPMNEDDFDFISLAEPLRLPLSDMECSLIEKIFCYSSLLHNGYITTPQGECYRLKESARKRVQEVFDLLVEIASFDERAIEKMDEYSRMKSMCTASSQPLTQFEVIKRVDIFGNVNRGDKHAN